MYKFLRNKIRYNICCTKLLQITVQNKLLTTKSGRRLKRTKMDENLKSRENPVVTTINTPEFKAILANKNVTDLKTIFDKYHHEIRIAGGAVRDLLMSIQPKDIDFATTATPIQMKEMFKTEGIRMVNMNGEKHGTITPRINDDENFEVTTLRIDVLTDGRHAEVEYTTDWKLDANRRDLTINSMFLGFDGSIYDYFFGYEDLKQRRVAFVGDPDVRIKEDFLRILRYFRFYGRIAEKADNHEESTLQTISQNVGGLQHISGERIWSEIKKILEGKYSGDLLRTMLHVGVGKFIGLPPSPNIQELDHIYKNCCKNNIILSPSTMLATLLKNSEDALKLHNRLKLSVYDRDLLFFIVTTREKIFTSNPLLHYQKMILNSNLKQKVAQEYVIEVLKYKCENVLLKQIESWDVPRFPVNGAILKENGLPPGKLCGLVLRRLKDYWAENEFNPTVDDLIKLIPVIKEEVEYQGSPQRFNDSK